MLKIAPSKNASVTLTNFYVTTSRKILRLVYRIRITPATPSLLRAERRSNEWIARLVPLTTHQYITQAGSPMDMAISGNFSKERYYWRTAKDTTRAPLTEERTYLVLSPHFSSIPCYFLFQLLSERQTNEWFLKFLRSWKKLPNTR